MLENIFNIHEFILAYSYYSQVTEHPLISPTVNETKLEMAFTSNSILVQREVDAFSFGSLVADCGGVLGLFIGLNFLMIWDWMVFLAIIFPKQLSTLKYQK